MFLQDVYTPSPNRRARLLPTSSPNGVAILQQEHQTDLLLKSFDLKSAQPHDYLSTPLRERYFPRLDIDILRSLLQPSSFRVDEKSEETQLEEDIAESPWKGLAIRDDNLPLTPPPTLPIPQISRFPSPVEPEPRNPFVVDAGPESPFSARQGISLATLHDFREVVRELMNCHDANIPLLSKPVLPLATHDVPKSNDAQIEFRRARDHLRVLSPCAKSKERNVPALGGETVMEYGGVKKFVGAINDASTCSVNSPPFPLDPLDAEFVEILLHRANEELAQAEELKALAHRLEKLASSRMRIADAVNSGRATRV